MMPLFIKKSKKRFKLNNRNFLKNFIKIIMRPKSKDRFFSIKNLRSLKSKNLGLSLNQIVLTRIAKR